MVHNHTEWCPVMWYQEEQRQRLGWVPSIEDYWHVRRGAPFDTCFALSASICIVIRAHMHCDSDLRSGRMCATSIPRPLY